MLHTDQRTPTIPGRAFAERAVEADGFQIRYLEAGQGEPLVWLHGGGGLHLSRAHDLLAEQFRVLAFEVPGFGTSPANTRSASYPALAATLVEAIRRLDLERIHLWGTSFGGRLAVWLAAGAPSLLETLVLEAPGAVVPDRDWPPPGASSPAELRQRLYAHPERQPDRPPPDPAVLDKQRALMARLPNPSRQETEQALERIDVPALVVFGTRDRVIPPSMGRVYRERMPNCHYVLVYDAGHEVGADRPEAFASLVSDFLVRREAFIVNQRSSLINP
jgi:pimeloyl-ACP methyl ester carboxylesterase